MRRRALVVGIDKYLNVASLSGCENDAHDIARLLESNEDNSPNYEIVKRIASRKVDTTISIPDLRADLSMLFDPGYKGDLLFYYSGHGALTQTGGYIATSDAVQNNLGIPMSEVLQLANQSHAREIVIILDCCHSGDLGSIPLFASTGGGALTLLRENMTVMAASTAGQVAMESGGHGAFTSALIDALLGGAADHMGWVTASAIYAYVERRFGEFEQRPVYRSYASEIGIVRQCAPLIERMKLYELVTLFPTEAYELPLDPEFEPEDEFGNLHQPVNQAKVELALLLKEYRDAGLLKPSINGEQLYWTARRNHTVQLTKRGKEYWLLVKNKRI